MKQIISYIFLIGFLTNCGLNTSNEINKEEILIKGAALYSEYGCMVCHSLSGDVVYGPPLNNIFMKEIKVIRNHKEETVLVNRKYLTKAITDPRYEKDIDYKNKDMPLTFLSKEEVDILVQYIIELNKTEIK